MFCYFVTDLHGKHELFEKLAGEVIAGKPDALFIGGDLTSASGSRFNGHFFTDFLSPLFKNINENTGTKVFIILGNDDPAGDETYLLNMQAEGLLKYVHNRKAELGGYKIFGYSFVPPTPFLFKDWEKYDVSRFVDPGSLSPEEGYRTYDIEPNIVRYATIANDLSELTDGEKLDKAIFLMHAPPYKTNLDRAANDGKKFNHVPLELHVGSIAVRRFIEKKKPLVTLHGHIHESARITGSWKDTIGNTYCFSAAHDGKELSLIKFDTGNLSAASRVLV